MNKHFAGPSLISAALSETATKNQVESIYNLIYARVDAISDNHANCIMCLHHAKSKCLRLNIIVPLFVKTKYQGELFEKK